MIILRGPQGSGKTTWAIQYMAENPNYLLVSRDTIRESLIPNHRATWYQRPDRQELEKLVTNLAWNMIQCIWVRGLEVIIDETNPNVSQLIGLATLHRREWVIHEMTTPLEECIRRDALREYPVGEEIIHRTAQKLGYTYAWSNWLGKPVEKISGKPFPDGNKTAVPTAIKINPYSKKSAFLIGDDLVDCFKCKLK